jgi:hypothetical protein
MAVLVDVVAAPPSPPPSLCSRSRKRSPRSRASSRSFSRAVLSPISIGGNLTDRERGVAGGVREG